MGSRKAGFSSGMSLLVLLTLLGCAVLISAPAGPQAISRGGAANGRRDLALECIEDDDQFRMARAA